VPAAAAASPGRNVSKWRARRRSGIIRSRDLASEPLIVEQVIDELPDVYRLVFVTRVIEGMSIEETADLVGIKPETVKTRLHRARQLVRDHWDKQIGPVLMDAFPFAGRRCARMTGTVMKQLGLSD
jgi:RNA polymerase sigma-70 factor, ECF subfamily